jgi:hypothetical protein
MSPDLPEGAAPFPGGDRGHATSLDSGRAATPGRIPWRPVGTGLISVGAPLGVALLHPLLGEVIAIIELAVMLTVLGTALFGSQILSERAFRLLRWLRNRPEPLAPSDQGTARGGRPPNAAKDDHRRAVM